MTIVWSPEVHADVRRLYLFLAQRDVVAADAVLDRLVAAPELLIDFPRRGSRLSEFERREVR